MHALRRIYESLQADGVLLDVHPQPNNSEIEIWQDGVMHPLGEIDQREDHEEIESARVHLSSFEQRGMFVRDSARFFDLLEHHPNVESWQNRWAEEGYRLVAPPELFEAADSLLTAGGGELVIREPVRATLLRRV